jgi:hypothetical protein
MGWSTVIAKECGNFAEKQQLGATQIPAEMPPKAHSRAKDVKERPFQLCTAGGLPGVIAGMTMLALIS